MSLATPRPSPRPHGSAAASSIVRFTSPRAAGTCAIARSSGGSPWPFWRSPRRNSSVSPRSGQRPSISRITGAARAPARRPAPARPASARTWRARIWRAGVAPGSHRRTPSSPSSTAVASSRWPTYGRRSGMTSSGTNRYDRHSRNQSFAGSGPCHSDSPVMRNSRRTGKEADCRAAINPAVPPVWRQCIAIRYAQARSPPVAICVREVTRRQSLRRTPSPPPSRRRPAPGRARPPPRW